MADYEQVMQKLGYLDETKGQIKNAIEVKGQEIPQDAAFREYVEKIMQIHDGDVKLFNNVEEMYADDKSKEGDLAIVYNTEMVPLYYGASFSAIKITKSIQFNTALPTSSYSMYCNGRNGQGYMSIYNQSTDTFRISVSSNDIGNFELYYTIDAEDRSKAEFSYGYKYISGESEPFIFDTDYFIFEFFDVMVWNSGSQTNLFTGAFEVSSVYYDGLYKYALHTRLKNSVYMGINPTIDSVTLNGKITLTDWLNMEYVNDNVCHMVDMNHFGGMLKIDQYSSYDLPYPYKALTVFSIYRDISHIFNYDNKHYIVAMSTTDEQYIDNVILNNTYQRIDINLDNWTYSIVDLPKTKLSVVKNETTYYFLVVGELNDDAILSGWYFNVDYGGSTYGIYITDYELSQDLNNSSWINLPPAFQDRYIPAPNQFTANDNSYIVTGYSAYGSNGNIYGDGTYLKHTTTSEFRNNFESWLPSSYSTSNYFNSVIQSGSNVNYLSLVNRYFLRNDSQEEIPSSNAIVVKMEETETETYTGSNVVAIYNSMGSQYNSFRHNDKVYYGYYGFNYNTNGGSSQNTIRRVYGLIYNLTDNEVYKTFNVDLNKRFFSDQGGWQGNDVCSISSMGYDWNNNQWVIMVTTGTYGFSNGAWFGYMYINADTGAIVKEKKWNLGKYGPSRSFYQVDSPMYNPSDRSFILPIEGFDSSGSNSILATMLKINSSDSISTLFTSRNSVDISGYSNLCGEYGFYKENCPVIFYCYSYENTTHYYFRNVVTNTEIDVTDIFTNSWPSFNSYFIVQDTYLYFLSSKRVDNDYKVIKLNSSTMTYELISIGTNYPSNLMYVDGEICVVISNKIYSINDVTTKLYNFYNSSNMYNDRSADGVISIDGTLQNEVLKVNRSTSGWTLKKYAQKLYVYEKCNSIPADPNKDLFIVWPTNTGSSTILNYTTSLYTSVLLKAANIPNYNDTLTPEEYQDALDKAYYIKTNEQPEESGGGV